MSAFLRLGDASSHRRRAYSAGLVLMPSRTPGRSPSSSQMVRVRGKVWKMNLVPRLRAARYSLTVCTRKDATSLLIARL